MCQDEDDLHFDIGTIFYWSMNNFIKNLLYKGHIAQIQAHDGRWYRVEIKNIEFKEYKIHHWVHYF